MTNYVAPTQSAQYGFNALAREETAIRIARHDLSQALSFQGTSVNPWSAFASGGGGSSTGVSSFPLG